MMSQSQTDDFGSAFDWKAIFAGANNSELRVRVELTAAADAPQRRSCHCYCCQCVLACKHKPGFLLAQRIPVAFKVPSQ